MGKAFLKVVLSFFNTIARTLLKPLDALIMFLIPDLSNVIQAINNFFNTHIYPLAGFFNSLLPPLTRQLIAIMVGVIVAYYSFWLVYTTIERVLALIKKLPLA